MSLTLVIFLLALGFLLVLLEVLVIPGVGVAGVLGAILLIVSVYGAYNISFVHGNITLATSFVLSGGLLYLSLRRKTWDRISLNTEISGKAGVNAAQQVKPGDSGETITRLNPMGTAFINGELREVTTNGEFLPEGIRVVVFKVEFNKIFVKPE